MSPILSFSSSLGSLNLNNEPLARLPHFAIETVVDDIVMSGRGFWIIRKGPRRAKTILRPEDCWWGPANKVSFVPFLRSIFEHESNHCAWWDRVKGQEGENRGIRRWDDWYNREKRDSQLGRMIFSPFLLRNWRREGKFDNGSVYITYK